MVASHQALPAWKIRARVRVWDIVGMFCDRLSMQVILYIELMHMHVHTCAFIYYRSCIFSAYMYNIHLLRLIEHVHTCACLMHTVSLVCRVWLSLRCCDPLLWIQGWWVSQCSLEYISANPVKKLISSIVWLLSIQCYNCPYQNSLWWEIPQHSAKLWGNWNKEYVLR